jgi:chemotaxis protein MotB
MVIIFVLLVFALAQGFLSVAVTSRDRALDRLNRQVAELAEMLALERGQAEELRGGLSRATDELAAAASARDAAQRSLATLHEERDRVVADRDATRTERDRLAARLADLGVAGRGNEERVAALERQLGEALARAEAAGGDAARVARDLTEARRGLAEAEQRRGEVERQAGALAAELTTARAELARVRDEAAALEAQLRADRATIEARAADVARLARELDTLNTRREEAERQAAAALTRAGTEERLRLAAEQSAAQASAATAEVERRRAALAANVQAALARAAEAERARAAAQAEAAEAARLRAAREAEARTAVARALEAESARAEAEGAAAAAASRAGASEAEAQAAVRRGAAAETAAAEASRRAGFAEEQRRLAETQAAEQVRLAEAARAQVAALTRQIEALRDDLRRMSAALDLEQGERRAQEATIATLGARLNAALAQRVEELQRYRSDFFGRLRQVLGERPEVRIVGDRFVFQGEVLFAPASADLSEEGRRQVRDLARVLLEVTPQIPNEIAWVVRVDGHADRSPLRGGRFASNWELAAARAIAVAQLLIAEGLAPNRVAATSFGDTQPIDPGEGAAAFARNRRIELRLTDR